MTMPAAAPEGHHAPPKPKDHGGHHHHHKPHKGGGHHGGEHKEHEEEGPEGPAMDAAPEGGAFGSHETTVGHGIGGHGGEHGGGEGGKESGGGEGKEKGKEESKSPFGLGFTFDAKGFCMAGSYSLIKGSISIPIYPPLNLKFDAGISVSAGERIPWDPKGAVSFAVGLGGDVGVGLSCGIPNVAEIYGAAKLGCSAGLQFSIDPKTWSIRGPIEAEGHLRVGVSFAGGLIDVGFNFAKFKLFECGFVKEPGKPVVWEPLKWNEKLEKIAHMVKNAGGKVLKAFKKVGAKIKSFFKGLKGKLFGKKKKEEQHKEAEGGGEGKHHIEATDPEQAQQQVEQACEHAEQHHEAQGAQNAEASGF